MNLILDTCAIVWAVSNPDRLSDAARGAMQAPEAHVAVSAISCAELACLAEAGKIAVTPHWRTWFDRAVADNGWSVLDIDLLTVQEAYSLPGAFHRDPADRFITASARIRRMHIVTADRKLLDYPHVQTIW